MAAEAERRVDAEALAALVGQIFERAGMGSSDAGLLADTLVTADARGVHSHGVIRVPTYVSACQAGRINPHPDIRVVSDHGGQVVVDGDNGIGQLTAYRANEIAIARGQ